MQSTVYAKRRDERDEFEISTQQTRGHFSDAFFSFSATFNCTCTTGNQTHNSQEKISNLKSSSLSFGQINLSCNLLFSHSYKTGEHQLKTGVKSSSSSSSSAAAAAAGNSPPPAYQSTEPVLLSVIKMDCPQ